MKLLLVLVRPEPVEESTAFSMGRYRTTAASAFLLSPPVNGSRVRWRLTAVASWRLPAPSAIVRNESGSKTSLAPASSLVFLSAFIPLVPACVVQVQRTIADLEHVAGDGSQTLADSPWRGSADRPVSGVETDS